MPNLADLLAIRFVDHAVDLVRLAAAANQDILGLLRALEKEIAARLSHEDLTDAARVRISTVLKDVRSIIADTYGNVRDLMSDMASQMAETEAKVAAGIVNDLVGVDLVTTTLPTGTLATLTTDTLIRGAPSSEWWARQAGDLAFRFAAQIRLGMADGETTGQIIDRVIGNSRLPGIMEIPRYNAAALVQTSVQTVANNARLEVFRLNSDVIRGVQQLSTLDERTSDVCIAYDGEAWDFDGNPLLGSTLPFSGGPPRHFNCRSVLIPITKSWAELGVAASEVPDQTRASMDGQVAAKLRFGDWLATKSVDFQNQTLGVGKADLWRQGRLSLRNLLDQGGNPMSLEALKSKHGITD